MSPHLSPPFDEVFDSRSRNLKVKEIYDILFRMKIPFKLKKWLYMRLSDVVILTTSGWESTGNDFHFSFQDVESESHFKMKKGITKMYLRKRITTHSELCRP